ncbi:hypothetical protein T03_6733 [Trichinella britovi]|uniref:Uncharacterized protein n=1 Tax=Trichinella britovi TaxID=45882 RepID=A0A0V1DBX6_TRIBR|nr:hypothetical protein T03_6733 [Trichinella britovi]
MCLMSSCKGIDIWLEIVSVDSSEKYKLLLQYSSRRNKLLRWDHIRSRNSSTPIGPLSFYRPEGVDIDHFGYPWTR